MSVASLVFATSLRALPRKQLSYALGCLTRVEGADALLQAAIGVYCRAYGVDLKDYEVPPHGFATFDEFFTRRLKEGMRPVVAAPRVLVSPSDGRVEDAGPIEPGARFAVKGRPYELGELLGDEAAALEFHGGQFAVIYLAPSDYHRVHAPVSGDVVAARHVPGTLFPVNSIGVAHVPRLFARNERVVVYQETDVGRIATVLVGAIGVGRISLSFDDSVVTNDRRAPGLRTYSAPRPRLERGDELGTFHMGSTVVLVLPKAAKAEFCVTPGQTVRMGEAFAKRPE